MIYEGPHFPTRVEWAYRVDLAIRHGAVEARRDEELRKPLVEGVWESEKGAQRPVTIGDVDISHPAFT